jgi:hypothetical protein
MGDALALDLITPEAGAIYVMDRGYVDFRVPFLGSVNPSPLGDGMQ